MDTQSLKEAFKRDKKLPYVKEISPGLWEIFDGTNTLHTGDGGKKMFDEAIRNISNESTNTSNK